MLLNEKIIKFTQNTIKKFIMPVLGNRNTESKISPEHITQLDEYLKQCWDDFEQFTKSEYSWLKGDSTTYENILKVRLPSIAWYLSFLRQNNQRELLVDQSTILTWKSRWATPKLPEENQEDYDLFVEFSQIMWELKLLQEEMLLNGSISQRYSSVIAKMLLTNHHGYKDESTTNVVLWMSEVLQEAEDRFK